MKKAPPTLPLLPSTHAVQACACALLLIAATLNLRSADDPAAPPPKEIPPRRIAAAAAAHDDPIPGMREEAERWWNKLVDSDRPIPNIPLPDWMAHALKRRPPLTWPADNDYAAWAALLEHPDFTEPRTVLSRLATPAAKAHAPAVIPWLLQHATDSREIATREAARDTLVRMGGPEVAREFAKALQSASGVGAEELTLLHELAPRESVELIKAVLSRHLSLKGDRGFAIVEAVAKMEEPLLAEVLVPYLRADNLRVRQEALTSLRKLGSWHALDAALDSLARDDENVPEALLTIGELGDHRLYPILAEYLESRTERHQFAAATAAARASLSSLAPRIAALAGSTAGWLQAGLIDALATLQARQFIPHITRQLATEAAEPALAALTKLNAVETVPQIIALRDSTEKTDVKVACVRSLLALRAMNRGEAVRLLTALLDQAWPKDSLIEELVRLNALESAPSILRAAGKSGYRIDDYSPLTRLLYEMGFSEHTPLLTKIFAAGDSDTRRGCLMYIHNYRVAECAPLLVSVVQSGESYHLRRFAIRALLYAGGPDSFRVLAEFLLRDEPEGLKETALRTLDYAAGDGERLPAEVARAVREFASRTGVPDRLREWAINILAVNASGPETDALLLTLLREQPPPSVRKTILGSFSAEAPKEAAAAMAAVLRVPDGWNDYHTALEGLERMKATEFAEDVADVAERGKSSGYYAGEMALRLLWSWGDRRYFARMGTAEMRTARTEEEAALMLPRLLDQHITDAFAEMEEVRMTRHLHRFIEAALDHRDHRPRMLFAARMLYAEDRELVTALQWLGDRADAQRPPLPYEAAKARGIVEAINRVRQEAMENGAFKLTVKETGALMAEIIGAAQWSWRDAEWLEGMAAELKRDVKSKEKAAGVLALAQTAREEHSLQRTKRAALWTAAALPVLWLIVLLLYPWSRLAQWMVWTRWTRRWLGLGCIGPMVLILPRLRAWLWRPFREALVPPGEVVSFDEWTFFDAVRATPASGGGALPALRVFSGFSGVGVLTGASGLGKTTLLQALAASATQPVALLRAAECGEGVLAALRARLPRQAQGDPNFLRALVQRKSPDIFVDAVHEALPEVRARLTEEVNSLAGANILLTTQPVDDWTRPQGAAEWQLEPLSARDIAPFLLKQGTAAVEAAGAGSLAERQRAFAARTAEFLQHFESLPSESAEAAALRRMLGNPMEAVLAAELLAAGQMPDPNRLLAQRMEHLEEDYTAQCGGEFPAAAFAEHLRSWRASGAPVLKMEVFGGVAVFLAKHRLLRKSADGQEAWRFRHDKVMEWFLRPAAG